MLAVIACLVGLFVLLVIADQLNKHKILKGENHRKFLHISAGCFIAFWPWIISWQAIQILSILMLLVIIANRYWSWFNYHGKIGRATYGDFFLALAILICALITDNKIFFAIAILEVALADGLAAIVGMAYGKGWTYKVFGYKKTVIGSMVFWIVSAEILTAGLLAANNVFSFQDYYFLLLFMPPILTVVENLAVLGIDNLLLPIFTILILRAFQS
jgi:dolichol kinase